jgi:Spy/CpxP family protein refolding chaperone
MRKLLSILFAAALSLSISSVSFAADAQMEKKDHKNQTEDNTNMKVEHEQMEKNHEMMEKESDKNTKK